MQKNSTYRKSNRPAKLKYLLFAGLLCWVFPVQAQFQKYFTAGIRSGIAVSTLAYLPNTEPDFGFQAAGMVSYRFSRVFGLTFEPGFSQQGAIVRGDTYRLNYLQVPVLLEAHLNQIVVQGGLYRAQLLNAESRRNIFTEDAAPLFNRTDGGFCGGVVFKPEDDFFIGFRYCYGLNNINNGLLSSGIIANRTVHILAGYAFRLSKKQVPNSSL